MKPPSSDLARVRPLLGTLVEIAIGEGESGEAIDAAFEEIALIHWLMSFHETQSDVSRLNGSAPGECVEIEVRTFQVLTAALCFSRESAGAFDVTIGAQLVAAGLLPDDGFDPDDECSHRDLVLLPENRAMRRGAAIVDLGDIAKGYAVDRVAVLRQWVVSDALTKVVRLAPRQAQGMPIRYGAQALMVDHCGVRMLSESNREPYSPHWLQ